MAVYAPGTVTAALKALRESPEPAGAEAKFTLAAAGDTLEAETIDSNCYGGR